MPQLRIAKRDFSRQEYSQPKSTRPLAANVAFLLLVLAAQHFAPENFWTLAWLVFAPAQIFLLPTMVLLLMSARKKKWKIALAHFAILLVAWPVLCGWNFAFPALHTNRKPVEKLRVMSYNIRYGSRGINDVAAIIAAQNPDIVCLQEVIPKDAWPDPLPALKKKLPEYSVSRYGQLVTLSRWPIAFQKSHSLPRYDGCGVLETHVFFNRQILRIYNVHFINPVDGALLEWPGQIQKRARIRRDQLQLLTRLSQSQSSPYLIAGDFNTPARGRTNRALQALGTDAFATTETGFGYSFPAAFPLLRIDRIFSSPTLQPQQSRVLPVCASDHRPLVVDFFVK